MLRNLHFAGPLSASLQNNTDTLEIDCDSYEKAETYTQAEVNSVVAAAVDALNIDQYATDTDVSTAVSDALVPYYTAAQVDAEIAANGFDASQYWTRTESDSRYFVQTANAGFTSLIRENVTPPTIRALLPRAPLSTNVLFSGTALELLCDAYSKTEADGRYVQSGNVTSLDSRYFVTTANASFTSLVRDSVVPQQIKALLPRVPLSINELFSGTTLNLLKSESDGRYYTKAQSDAAYAPLAVQAEQQANTSAIGALDSRITAQEGSGGVPADISCTSLTASSFVSTFNFTATGNTTGVDALFTQDVQTPVLRPISAVDNHLTVAAGIVSIRFVAADGVTQLVQFSTNEAYFAVPTRCDHRLTIDDVSGPAEGLFVNENGVTVLGPGLAVAGTMRATAQVTTPRVVAEASFPYLTLVSGTARTRIVDATSNVLLAAESDETQCLSRVLSVSHSAAGGVAGAVLKNTASTGVARLQLDANTATGFAQLEVASTGNCTLRSGCRTASRAPRRSSWRPMA